MEKSAVVLIVEKFMANVKEALADGENIYLRGFGTFLVKTRKERIARNISRKTAVIIPEPRTNAKKDCVRTVIRRNKAGSLPQD